MALSAGRNDFDSWVRNEDYLNSFLIKPDETLDHALQSAERNGLRPIAVSVAQGKLLNLLARTMNAKRILEVGTLAGYSAIWLARALPEDGSLITLEISQKHVDIAKANFEHAGVASKIEVIVGSAGETLPKLKPSEPFDLVFIDADKESCSLYYKEARRMTRKGGVIIVDNVIRYGKVADPNANSSDVLGVREVLNVMKEDKGVDATAIATVGEKDYDGFAYVYVL